MNNPMISYHMLTPQDQGRLRLERILQLEADYFRGQLRLEDAQTDLEKESIAASMDEIHARLTVHYEAVTPLPVEQPNSDQGSP